jgi:hypothetical protein
MAEGALVRKSSFGRLRRRFHGWLGVHPALYLPLVAHRRAFDGSRKAVGRDTELVIEGFPRCGNSFAFAAFRLAQPRPVRIAHHLHAPAQVIAAARRGIPALVVIRPPDDAVVSLLLRAPSWRADEAYAEYLRFYASILPYRERFVLAGFAEVVADFGAIVRRLNARFGTTFAEFAHTPENVQLCFDTVDDIARANGHARGAGFEMSVARPSASRDERKHAVRASLMRSAPAPLRAEAQRVHDLHVQGAAPA